MIAMTPTTETIVRSPIIERAAWMGAELARADEGGMSG